MVPAHIRVMYLLSRADRVSHILRYVYSDEFSVCMIKSKQRRGHMQLRGYAHIFDAWTTVKWAFPNFYRKPGLGYQKLGMLNSLHYHISKQCSSRNGRIRWSSKVFDNLLSWSRRG